MIENAVGITGGIGSGKSSVSAWISKQENVCLFDADQAVKALLETEQPGWHALQKILHNSFFNADKSLNKMYLRSKIFYDYNLRKQIEDVLHPLVFLYLSEQTGKAKTTGLKNSLVEVPLLYEAGWQNYFEAVIVVYASRKTCLNRIVSRDGCSKEEACSAMKSQISLKKKIKKADIVINNNDCWENTLTELQALQNKISLLF